MLAPPRSAGAIVLPDASANRAQQKNVFAAVGDGRRGAASRFNPDLPGTAALRKDFVELHLIFERVHVSPEPVIRDRQ